MQTRQVNQQDFPPVVLSRVSKTEILYVDTGAIPNHLRVQVLVLIFSKEVVEVEGEWTGNTVSIALLTLYRGGHHSKSIFLYSILSEIPTLYIFKKNAAIFSN